MVSTSAQNIFGEDTDEMINISTNFSQGRFQEVYVVLWSTS